MAEPKKASDLVPDALSDATTAHRRMLSEALNRAVARVENAKAELRKASNEERRLRAQLGKVVDPEL